MEKAKRALVKIMTAAMILLLFLSSNFLVACQSVDRYGFFCEETLVNAGLEDMPRLEYGKDTRTKRLQFYCNINEDKFDNYVSELYDYLLAQNYNYFGTQGEANFNLFETECTFKFCDDLSDHIQAYTDKDLNQVKRAIFVWGDSLGDERINTYIPNVLNNKNEIRLYFYYDAQSLSQYDYYYTVYMSINYQICDYYVEIEEGE